MIPVSAITGWLSSVTYVSALSLWALVSGHWSAWQAARVEVAQEAEAKEHAKEDLPLAAHGGAKLHYERVPVRFRRHQPSAVVEQSGSRGAPVSEPDP